MEQSLSNTYEKLLLKFLTLLLIFCAHSLEYPVSFEKSYGDKKVPTLTL